MLRYIKKGNNAPFMTIQKSYHGRSRLQNKYLQYPPRENFVNMKKMKNKCNFICRKSKIKYLKKSTEKGISLFK